MPEMDGKLNFSINHMIPFRIDGDWIKELQRNYDDGETEIVISNGNGDALILRFTDPPETRVRTP